MTDTVDRLVKIPTLRTAQRLREHLASLGAELGVDDDVAVGADSPLAQPIAWNGRAIGNRWCTHPMEGWDGTTTGGVTEPMVRRWRRFGESGAKLIWGGEAMAVRPDGRANPNQLIITRENASGIRKLRETLVEAHGAAFGRTDDLVIGFQLTHSGRFCRPNEKTRFEPRVAFRHPLLDSRFRVTSDDQVWADDELGELVAAYVAAAQVATECGADFVDVKHCHGYLLHEFLGAHTRPGRYGGSFENRTRLLREIVEGIRVSGNQIGIGVRLSAFDWVPFRPDPARGRPGKLGPGIPEDFSECLPYRYAFGCNPDNPVEYDLAETYRFVTLLSELGITLLNLSAGSPYYNPHIQRPAAYPPSDGYQPPEDPLVGVARQVNVVRQIKAQAPANMVMVGTGYSYLQEFLPHAAQHAVRSGFVDSVGLGRMVLAYPDLLADAVAGRGVQTKRLCRTFSDCTTAPRNGLVSGCYPLDEYYKASDEAKQLREIKKAAGV
ncbi:MAG: 2,4-dienoyl-CoA reductase [NADPH] [uncultured Chloroflexi bacterium]|uniref:2,4-dienoyl-CoA reductase [NADPH] n=1 Tax=uncultured Chloroflexota bacterium TaxID=166587 RepID=A0A6J4K767_9CHLR|nr:MAG: 2,4-dienoyl-CoA reductase [NADPH] [uncultured Chloroflexota bacterium]